MLSLKRLAYVLLIVISVCSVLLIYNINENNNRIVEIQNKMVEPQELIRGEVSPESDGAHYFVVGSDEKDVCKYIFANVKNLMTDMKLSWEEKTQITARDMKKDAAVLIFCDDSVGEYVDLQELGAFIENGGKVIFAAGIAENYVDAYLLPILGIREKSIRQNYTDYVFLNDLFPLQEKEMSYAGYSASTWIRVDDDAEVYVQDKEKEVPIVYTHPFGKGEVLVINATFLDNMQCMGVLTACMGILSEDFIYPVMGVECIYLDNFPVVTYVDDPGCMKKYGRTTEAFVRDVVWPVFQGICGRHELKYTSSVLNVANDGYLFPAVNESLFGTMGKSALQFDGELAYAFYSADDDEPLCRNEDFIKNFESTFINYKIGSLCLMSEGRMEDALAALDKNEVAVIRGKLWASNREERIMASENFTVFPEATNGVDMDGENLFAIHSVFTSYGMISHTFDINGFITMDDNSQGWDTNKYLLEEFEEKIIDRYDCLKKTTLSETTNWVNSYENLDYSWKKSGRKVVLTADRFVEEQAFIMRTESEIVSAEGADVEKIGNHYYMIRLKSSRAVLELAEGE